MLRADGYCLSSTPVKPFGTQDIVARLALQDCISGLTMICAGRKIVPLADHVQSLRASAVIET